MSQQTDGNTGGIRVEIYKIANRLKKKLGIRTTDDAPGVIDPGAIGEADKLIEALCEQCPATIGKELTNLSSLWDEMKDMPDSVDRHRLAQQIFTIAHEIKDLGSLCGYNLAAYFAESLRDYIIQTELSLEAQRVIIQAHVDALSVVHKQEIGEDDDAAEELKKMVKVAIAKYS